MYFWYRHRWIAAYFTAVSFIVYALISGSQFVDFEALPFWLVFDLILLLLLIILASVLWILIWTPVRRFYRGPNMAWRRSLFRTIRLVVLLGLVAMGWRLWLTTNPGHVQHAKDFVATAEPLIERYYDKHQHYPDSLNELALPTGVPWGLSYHAIHGNNEWPSGSREDGSYTILLGDLWYRNDGSWQFGGLY